MGLSQALLLSYQLLQFHFKIICFFPTLWWLDVICDLCMHTTGRQRFNSRESTSASHLFVQLVVLTFHLLHTFISQTFLLRVLSELPLQLPLIPLLLPLLLLLLLLILLKRLVLYFSIQQFLVLMCQAAWVSNHGLIIHHTVRRNNPSSVVQYVPWVANHARPTSKLPRFPIMWKKKCRFETSSRTLTPGITLANSS